MPVVSTAFMNTVLDGAFRSDLAPASLKVRAWIDNPTGEDAAEADFGDYSPATVLKADWEAAEGGEIATNTLISLGTPSSAASDDLRWWSLHDVDTDELLYYAPLAGAVLVVSSSSPVQIQVVVPYGFNNN